MSCNRHVCKYYAGGMCNIDENHQTRCVAIYDKSKCDFTSDCRSCSDNYCFGKWVDYFKQYADKEKKEPRKEIPDVKTAYAYVDGSYDPNTNVYGYGGFLYLGEEKIPISGANNNEEVAKMRNVAGELLGAMTAVIYARKYGVEELKILYDYTGIEYWVTGKWNAKNEYTQKYVSFMRTCGLKLSFEKIKGHSGVKGNEEADRMAKDAVRRLGAKEKGVLVFK